MAKEPASIRYKNPGAMWGGDFATKWGAQAGKGVSLNDGTGQGNTIAVFPTYVDGIAAQVALWRAPRYRNKKFKDAIIPWSGGNNVPSYIKLVKSYVPGFSGETVINDEFLLGPHGIAFLKAQAFHEAGRKYPASDAEWEAGREKAFRGGYLAKAVKVVVENKGKIIATARTTGLTGGAGTLVAATVKEVAGPSGETVEKATPIINQAGEVVGQVKTVVEWVPADLVNQILAVMQTRGFAWCIIALIVVAWGTSYLLRRNEGPK